MTHHLSLTCDWYDRQSGPCDAVYSRGVYASTREPIHYLREVASNDGWACVGGTKDYCPTHWAHIVSDNIKPTEIPNADS